MKPYKIVAITGRSGSGKSTLAAYYASLGYPVLDADKVARDVTAPGSPCLPLLAEAFGSDILTKDGTLQRQMLAQRAFATPQTAQQLTDITHPEIVRRLLQQVQTAAQQGAKLIFVDGAVIVDAMFEQYCDFIVVLLTSDEQAIARIMQRDNLTHAMAVQRLGAQLSAQELRQAADYIIENCHTPQALQEQAQAVLKILQPD